MNDDNYCYEIGKITYLIAVNPYMRIKSLLSTHAFCYGDPPY